jgi:hypothetical protein
MHDYKVNICFGILDNQVRCTADLQKVLYHGCGRRLKLGSALSVMTVVKSCAAETQSSAAVIVARLFMLSLVASISRLLSFVV